MPNKKPKGQPLPRTDERLDLLSVIRPVDIEAAKAKVAGTVVEKLLDAELVDDQQEEG